MAISVQCPHCSTELTAETTVGPRRATCPQCGEGLIVPGAGPRPGVEVGGFRLGRRLGHGGMGEVYLAEQLSMQRPVALKILSEAVSSDGSAIRRFHQEVRMQAKMDHPNIVTAFEAGEEAGVHYLAMAFVDGETLDQRLKRDGALPEEEVLRLVRQVAEALAYGWQRHQAIHRDIKPANIMVDRKGNARVLDLGLSKSLSESVGLTVTGSVMGTPQYMSPEQAQSVADIDFRSDVYSLGATLYHLATGTYPYSGDTTLEILMKHVQEPLPPPRERNPNLSRACEQLIESMMAKDRAERPQSWEAVIEDIQAALSHRSQRTRRLRRGEQAARTHQRTPGSNTSQPSADGDHADSTTDKARRAGRPSLRMLLVTAGLLGLLLAVLVGVLLSSMH